MAFILNGTSVIMQLERLKRYDSSNNFNLRFLIRFWKILSRRRPINKKRKNMKKQYNKPAMRVVKMQQRHIICTSPGEQASIQVNDVPITDEQFVW